MASFGQEGSNPSIDSTGLTNLARPIQPNRAWGDLFSGLANTTHTSAQGADQEIKTGIGLNATNGMQGAGDAVLKQAQDTNSTLTSPNIPTQPATLDGSTFTPASNTGMRSLNLALKQGTIDRATYMLRANELTKQMQGQFPGYADQVENDVSFAARRNPAYQAAEALDSVNQQIMTNSAASQKQFRTSFDKYAPAVLTPSGMDMYKKLTGSGFDPSHPENTNLQAAESVWATVHGNTLTQQDQSRQFALAGAGLRSKGLVATNAMSTVLRSQSSELLSGFTFDTAAGKATISQVLDGLQQSGKTLDKLSPEDMQQLNSGFLSLKAAAQNKLNTFLIDPANQASIASMSPAQLGSMKNEFLKTFDDLATSVSQGRSAYVKFVTDEAHLQKAQTDQAIAKAAPMWETVKRASVFFKNDPVAMDAFLNNGKIHPGSTPAQDLANEAPSVYRALGGVALGTLSVNDLAKAGSGTQPELTARAIIQAPSLFEQAKTQDQVSTLVTNLHNLKTNDLTTYAGKDPSAFVNAYLSPSVTAKVFTLGSKTDKDNYVAWANEASVSVLSSAARELKGYGTSNDTLRDLKIDSNGKLSIPLAPAPSGVLNNAERFLTTGSTNGNVEGTGTYGWFQQRSAQSAVDKVNNWVDKMQPIWKAQGITPQQGVSAIFYNQDVSKLAKSDGTVQSIVSAIGNWVGGAEANQTPQPVGTSDPNTPNLGNTYRGRDRGNQPPDGTGVGLNAIRSFENFIPKAKYDVNAFRVGYGSDTITNSDGSHTPVNESTTITKEEAERDLQRRVDGYRSSIASTVGKDAWENLGRGSQAALLSVYHNYGEIPNRIISAVKSGNSSKISEAILSLQNDNKGINRNRRQTEAALAGMD